MDTDADAVAVAVADAVAVAVVAEAGPLVDVNTVDLLVGGPSLEGRGVEGGRVGGECGGAGPWPQLAPRITLWECCISEPEHRMSGAHMGQGWVWYGGHMANTRAHGGGRRQGAPGLDRWKDTPTPRSGVG